MLGVSSGASGKRSGSSLPALDKMHFRSRRGALDENCISAVPAVLTGCPWASYQVEVYSVAKTDMHVRRNKRTRPQCIHKSVNAKQTCSPYPTKTWLMLNEGVSAPISIELGSRNEGPDQFSRFR
jgi:hypothetical protein